MHSTTLLHWKVSVPKKYFHRTRCHLFPYTILREPYRPVSCMNISFFLKTQFSDFWWCKGTRPEKNNSFTERNFLWIVNLHNLLALQQRQWKTFFKWNTMRVTWLFSVFWCGGTCILASFYAICVLNDYISNYCFLNADKSLIDEYLIKFSQYFSEIILLSILKLLM